MTFSSGMGERFLVWGAGGHGRVVADLIRANGHEVVGFVDRRGEPGLFVDTGGFPRLPVLPEEAVAGPDLPLGATATALGIGDNQARAASFRSLADRYPCPKIVHPAAVLAPGVTLGQGTVVLAGAVINVDASIGAGVIVNTRAVVEHECRIGDGVHVAPGAVVCGGTELGDLVWIGAGATVVPRMTIGRGAVVGAGSVVIRDVSEGLVVAGCPARPLKARRD